MTRRTRRNLFLAWMPRGAMVMTAIVAPLTGCEEDGSGPDLQSGTFYGAEVKLGQGTVRTYTVLEQGDLVELGVAFSESALTGLPDEHTPGGIPMPDGHHAFDWALQMPADNPTPYRFVGLGWNPGGHEPPGIYDLPHFDVHFYSITEAERAAIVPTDPQWAQKANNIPAAEFLPQGYIHTGVPMGASPAAAAVPMMGVHWVDPASPELNGKKFTSTFIYGTWDGKLTFAEPMVTKEFMESKPNFRVAVPTAQKYAPTGLYPGEYRVYWDASSREYRIAISGFAKRG